MVEGSSRAKNQLDVFNRFDRTPTCDRHRRTDGHRAIASARGSIASCGLLNTARVLLCCCVQYSPVFRSTSLRPTMRRPVATWVSAAPPPPLLLLLLLLMPLTWFIPIPPHLTCNGRVGSTRGHRPTSRDWELSFLPARRTLQSY